jgi:hypothetical protein
MTLGIPSPSGARLAGDDYQHLLTWVHALRLLLVDGGVTKIEFEANDTGNVDDLVIHRIDEPTLYHQIKFATSNRTPLTHEWFTTPPSGSKHSPLQRFHQSYTKLTAAEKAAPEMALHTNRLPAPRDPILELVSGTDCKLVPRLRAKPKGSAAGKLRRAWAEHLGITEEELLTFLGHLAIRSGRVALDDLQEQCTWAMRAVGFRPDVAAVLAAIGALRELIRTGVRELDAAGVRELADKLQLLAGTPRATLLVQSLSPDSWPETATAAVDWVDLFDGDDPASRRQLRDPAGWNKQLKPELIAAVDRIRRARLTDVDVRGTMRLATGLLVGVQLSEVSGFNVTRMAHDGEWSSHGRRNAADVEREFVEISQGDELAIAIAVSQPIRDDVVAFIQSHKLAVDRLVVYSPPGGASRQAVASPEVGLALAAAISSALRDDTHDRRDGVHLFQSCPLPLAILIGHLWNRMPQTQLYEDLGPGGGYIPVFVI